MRFYFFALIVIFGYLNICSANDEAITAEIDEMKTRIKQLEERNDSLKIGAGATFIGQGTIDANNTNKEDVADATYSIDMEMEKEFGEYGLAFVHLEAGGGGGLDGDELDLFSNVNRDAGDSSNNVQVTEAWYEHKFLNGKLIVASGKLDPTVYLDSNAIANDETTQFLGTMFRNNTAIEFPDDNGPGVRVGFLPLEWFEIDTGIFDDNADWEDVFKNLFVFGQINFKPNLSDLEGNYRLYLWRDDSEHTEFLDTTRDEKVNWGWGISMDQQILKSVIVFVRYGWEDERVSNIEWVWSTGLQISGNIWNRDGDTLGVAFGQNIPGGDYGKAGNPDHHESHFEGYYNLHINDHLSISPDFQVVWNPKGVASNDEGIDDTVYVFGVRTQIDF